MVYKATLHQVMQLVMKAEDAGEIFYRSLAAQVEDKKVKDICLFLASEERNHHKTFKQIDAEIKNDLSEKNFSIDVLSLMNEGLNILKESRFSAGIFSKKDIDVRACLEIALHAEKEAVRIYQTIQGALLDGHQILLHDIINEENIHAQTLQNVLDRLAGKKVLPPPEPFVPVAAEEHERTQKLKKARALRDYSRVFVIFMGLLILIFMMMGPRIFSKVVNAVVVG